MARGRQIDWARATSALRQAKWEARPPVREERLRSGDGLVAWRGHSGKRYVFHSFPLAAPPSALPRGGAVAAVTRGDEGSALLRASPAMPAEAFRDWLRDAGDEGATEILVHALTRSPDQASALVEDLGFEVRESPCYGIGF